MSQLYNAKYWFKIPKLPIDWSLVFLKCGKHSQAGFNFDTDLSSVHYVNITKCFWQWCTLWIRNFQWLIFFIYIFLSMLSGNFLLCQTFWSKYLWIFLTIYVDYSYFDAQVRCTYLVPNMTLTLMFNRNYNNLRYSIKKMKSLLEQKFFLLKSVCEFSLKDWQ